MYKASLTSPKPNLNLKPTRLDLSDDIESRLPSTGYFDTMVSSRISPLGVA